MSYRTPEEICSEIKRLARERGVGESQLAGALGVSEESVRRLLNRERGLSAAELAGIAETLSVSVDDLLRRGREEQVRGADGPEAKAALKQVDELIENHLYFKALVP
jgi:transcriptional regulator with XRE-family HTH domain